MSKSIILFAQEDYEVLIYNLDLEYLFNCFLPTCSGGTKRSSTAKHGILYSAPTTLYGTMNYLLPILTISLACSSSPLLSESLCLKYLLFTLIVNKLL